MDSLDSNGVVTFDVEPDEEDGGFCAHAKVGTWSLNTQGDDLDELNAMIQDLIGAYNAREARKIEGYSLHFEMRLPLAA